MAGAAALYPTSKLVLESSNEPGMGEWSVMSEPTLRELKSRAQLLKPVIRLGKSGISAEFLAALEETFRHTDLVKVRFEEFKDQRKSLSKELAEKSASRLIQQIGHTAVYYKPKA
jgi:RNA-binding protein